MTNEERQLLLSELCARLPYKVKVLYTDPEDNRLDIDVAVGVNIDEPNRRTKAGKRMRERIYAAMGNMFNCINFFEMFGTSIPYYGKSFTVPKGFLHNDTVYMIFDDANYNDISKNMAGQFTEITTGEFNEALASYNESQKGKGL